MTWFGQGLMADQNKQLRPFIVKAKAIKIVVEWLDATKRVVA